ncbi:MAG: serine hydrolase [Opitutaceae bacterium]
MKLITALALAWLPHGIDAAEPMEADPLPGQIVVDPDDPRWLKRHGESHVFICGPGDPEDFLYHGTRNPDGTRSGDQVELIDKLVAHGGNCIYMQAVRTHGGDARDDHAHNPFIDSDPAKGLDEQILDQWEEWFTRMDRNGIIIYFLFYDDGSRIWDTGDEVGAEERAFFERIVRRFRHHKNLIWLVSEESEEKYSHARVQALAGIIRETDTHGHPIGNHHLSGTRFKAWEPGGALDHFSMQLTLAGARAHAGAVEAFQNAEGRYQVIYSESTAAPTDPDGMRRHAWAVAMAGVMPMLLHMDIASTPAVLLEQCRHLQEFFEATDFYTMEPHDDLAHAGTTCVLADPGRSYIVYSDQPGGKLGLEALPAGRCVVTWLDCLSGATRTEQHAFTQPGDRAFARPSTFGAECAAWIWFPDIRSGRGDRLASDAATTSPLISHENEPPVVEDRELTTRSGAELYIQLRFTDADGPGPYSYTIVRPPRHGVLTGDNNDRTYAPNAGFTGTDEFVWKVDDGQAGSPTATVTILVEAGANDAPDATSYFPPPESRGGWRTLDTAEDARRIGGMDPEKLEELRQWLIESDERDFAADVIRNGYIVLEVERGNSAKTDARRVASVSKAVCATVLAIASEMSRQGRTPRKMSFDDPAFEFIPWAHPLSDPRKAQITVRQLFNHTSGICPEAIRAKNGGTWEYILGHSGDPKTEKLAFDPGQGCGYSTHAFHHASLVCENVTGLPYDEFAIKHLFEPIGCERWWFQFFDGKEIGRHPSHALGMPARDLARIAYCMLRGGRWGERQVIPKWFIDGIATPQTPRGLEEMRRGRDSASYAEAWELPMWLTDKTAPGRGVVPGDARFKRGSGGQFIAYVPGLDLVITRQTGGSGQWQYDEYLLRACAAVLRSGDAILQE